MTVHVEERSYETRDEIHILDVTGDLAQVVAASGVAAGIALVFAAGSTAAVTTIEHEPGVLDDLRRAVARLAPRDEPYAHDARWSDGNGFSHVRAALLGPSVALPVAGGRPALGTWQQVVLLDLDNRPRTRRVLFQVVGE